MPTNKQSITHFVQKILPLTFIIVIAFVLRTFNIDWDQGHYLHPDERFLVMVIKVLNLPTNIFSYLDPQSSPLNPYNHNFSFFVYGHLPITIAKITALLSGHSDYLAFRFVGRYLSALSDVSSTLAVYFLAKTIVNTYPKLFTQKQKFRAPLLSALCYAVFVFPIQQAHFFTVDLFTNAFFLWSLVFVLQKHPLNIFLAAVFFGFGLGSKLNVAFALPLLFSIILLKKATPKKKLLWILLFLCATYLTLRIADPYIFAKNNLLDPRLNPQYLQNLKFLKEILSGKVFYPPGVQWYSKNSFFPLTNIFLFGVGPGFFLIALFGFISLAKKISKQKNLLLFLVLNAWLLTLFIFQSLQLVKTMRYFLFLYPFIAVYSGAYLAKINNRFVKTAVFLSGFVWTIMFLHIYTIPHTRIQASNWMYKHLPENSKIIWEYWDDPLPLNSAYPQNKRFNKIVIDFYYPDTKQKWQLIAKKLKYSDYIALSSNRQWASLGAVPHLYPITSKYYRLLLANQLGFKKIAEFKSYPTLQIANYKLQIPDTIADEAFTVYDHPKVIILQKHKSFSEKEFLHALFN